MIGCRYNLLLTNLTFVTSFQGKIKWGNHRGFYRTPLISFSFVILLKGMSKKIFRHIIFLSIFKQPLYMVLNFVIFLCNPYLYGKLSYCIINFLFTWPSGITTASQIVYRGNNYFVVMFLTWLRALRVDQPIAWSVRWSMGIIFLRWV